MSRTKTIGVVGGMGPMATVEFFRRLVAKTDAASDQEHVHILIDNDPSVPDRTGALLRGEENPVPALQRMARRLEAAGAELLAMPCNTAHAFIEEIRVAVSIPVLDMIEETAAAVDGGPVGLLATDGTIETGLYQRALATRRIDTVSPGATDQATVMEIIRAVKAGEDLDRLTGRIAPVIDRLAAAGAKAAVAACTELSLLAGKRLEIRWIDALDVLVRAALRHAGARSVVNGEETR